MILDKVKYMLVANVIVKRWSKTAKMRVGTSNIIVKPVLPMAYLNLMIATCRKRKIVL